ncbi:putative drug exporter of the RND superfamily [Actinomadura meyerae]|uniref:Putative drug exporter of the RND superfamily n=1 Tax=Actinomadura meyerae TaxID=240840 RepID=A0A239F002_9ACTN|nr:MMPL family transporter [Actinomadura meyerae]SNS50330.1 putative drug exporter of the RND superfamily [Actinomadura meyerae]
MTFTEPDQAETAQPAPPPGGAFARIAAFAHRRRWLALILWVAVMGGVWTVASVVGDDYRNDFSLPGTESQQAADLLAEHGAARAGDTVEIVLHHDGGLREPGVQQRVRDMLDDVAGLPRVDGVRSLYDDQAAISRDGTIGYATVMLDTPSADMPATDTERILDTARQAEREGLQVELGGDAARLLAEGGTGAAEGAGLLAALIILVLMFGTVIAAGLPIIIALFAVGSTVGVIILASQVFTVAEWTPPVMILVGLGVGIDYALLIFARYRAELVRGREPERATMNALDAAGRSVFFAACTVILALLGLVALGIGSIQGMALSVALTVLVTMLASLTLLPALLGIFGRRFARQFTRRAQRRKAKGKADDGTGWRRLAATVQRRPLAALLAGAVLLGALAVPALGIRLGFSDAGGDPAASTSRQAYDLLSEGFGPGFNGPLLVVTDGGEQAGAAAARALNDTPGVQAAAAPVPTPDGKAATILVFPASSPQDKETSQLVGTLREDVLPRLSAANGGRYLVGGPTAAAEDYSGKLGDRMPLFMAIVVGLSVLLLAAVFRSVLIPLKAAVLNLLSIGAALGAMKLVYQDGLFGIEGGPIEAFLPVMIFAIVFGLSMDYEIFLISRMHEEWTRSEDTDPSHAVREGLAHTGAVITAAGSIMVVIFAAFVLSPERMLQQAGFGMAVAIFVDAVIIRCLIVPAAMQLMGRHAWWLPSPLARLLPEVKLERVSD